MDSIYLRVIFLVLNVYSLSSLEIGTSSRALECCPDSLFNSVPVISVQLGERDPEVFGDFRESLEATTTIDQADRHTDSPKAPCTANTM